MYYLKLSENCGILSRNILKLGIIRQQILLFSNSDLRRSSAFINLYLLDRSFLHFITNSSLNNTTLLNEVVELGYNEVDGDEFLRLDRVQIGADFLPIFDIVPPNPIGGAAIIGDIIVNNSSVTGYTPIYLSAIRITSDNRGFLRGTTIIGTVSRVPSTPFSVTHIPLGYSQFHPVDIVCTKIRHVSEKVPVQQKEEETPIDSEEELEISKPKELIKDLVLFIFKSINLDPSNNKEREERYTKKLEKIFNSCSKSNKK